MLDQAALDDSLPVRTRGPGHTFWAPRPFVRVLREGTGNPFLDVYWDPNRALFAQHPDVEDLCRHPPCQMDENGVVTGAWVVMMHTVVARTMTWRGRSLTFLAPHAVDVFALDGLYSSNPKLGNAGLPMTLGTWLINELNFSDAYRRGTAAVRRDKNAAHRKAWELQFASSRKMADDMGNDNPLLRSQREIDKIFKNPSLSREQREKQIAELHRRTNRRARDNEKLLKDMGL